MIMKIVEVLLLVGFVFLLVKSTEVLIDALKKLASVGGFAKFGVTAFILAFATSLPELVVGVVSALEGDSAIALGNVLGSNIADLSIVIGGASLVGGGIKVVGEFLRRDLFLSFLAGSLPLLMLVDGRLSRLDGLVLLIVYVVYVVTVLREKSEEIGREEMDESVFKRLFFVFKKDDVNKDVLRFFVGVAVLLFSSHAVVKLAERVAVGFNVPLLVVGLVLVALGTSLPELVFELKAIRSREVGMVFGDLLGSIVANSTLIMGVVALIGPFRLDGGLRSYLVGTIGFVGLFLVFWLFSSTKKRLERWEGLVLVLGYALFVAVVNM